MKKYLSPIRELVLVVEGGALVELRLDGAGVNEKENNDEDREVLQRVCGWLDKYFDGEAMGLDGLKLAPRGTEFQKEVWGILRKIQYGKTMSYGEIAQKIATKRGTNKMSARAVGQAIGKNPIPIIVPCHRVMGKDGGLTGYSGGIEKKIWLLKHEGILE